MLQSSSEDEWSRLTICVSCPPAATPEGWSLNKMERTELIMGMPITVAIPPSGTSEAPEAVFAAAFDYFRRTGIYPINHGVVIKNSVLKDNPGIEDKLTRAFEASKAEYLKNMKGNEIASWDKAATVNAAVVGDPYPFGIEKNRKALEAITQFAFDQKMVPRKYTVEELFTPLN